MILPPPGAPRSGSARAASGYLARQAVALAGFFNKSLAIASMEMRKLWHDPTELFTRAIQPALWLLLFGQVFARARAIPTGSLSYIDFLAPGILAQSVLFIAIFNGISIIWERDQGIVHKFLASPTPRSALVLGKALSAGVRGLSQTGIVYLLCAMLGVSVNIHALALVGVLAFVLLGAALFSTFSLIIACIVKTRERFMGVGQVLTMPLFFASNAIYPTTLMPVWLQRISGLNPLTYQVDGLRTLMLAHGAASSLGLGFDLVVLLVTLACLVAISAWLYPNIVR